MNPYGNSGFNRINQQQRQVDPRYQQQQQQQQNQRQVDPRFQQQYVDPRFQQQYIDPRFQQAGYQQPITDPRFQQPVMDPRFQQAGYQQQYVDPRFQQPMQQSYGQPYGSTVAQQQNSFGRMDNPMQQQNSFNQIGERTISAAVEDVEINSNPQTQQQPTINQPVKNEVRCQDLSPADGHEFPPYYDKDTERLKKVVDENTCTYIWKIVKGANNE